MTRISIDDQLEAARVRRERACDLLIRSLIEIDTLTNRIDVLLERKADAAR